MDEAVDKACRSARRGAPTEMDRPLASLPEHCPYDWRAITQRPFAFDRET